MGMYGGSPDTSASDEATRQNQALAAQQRQDELDRQAAIQRSISGINDTFSQFDPTFYAKKQKEFTDYFQPQVDYQYNQAKQDTLFQLARQGLTDSSAGAKEFGSLAKSYGDQTLGIQSGANGFVNQAKNQIESQRNALVNQATATANPETAALAASNAVGALHMVQPTAGYSPLAGLFQTISGPVGNAVGNYNAGLANNGLLGQTFGAKTSSSARKVN